MSGLVRVTPLSIDAAFDDLVRRTFTPRAASWMPAADIIQDGEDIILIMDLPGVETNTLDVELKERALRIAGSRAERLAGESERVVRAEIRRGDFARTFRVPAYITADAISATYESGVLHVRIRGAHPAPTSQKITIKGVDKNQEASEIGRSENTSD